MKRFLDSLAYFFLIGDTQGIETEYKKIMHDKREIPVSSCPSYVENILYSSGAATELIDQEERASFRTMIERLDEKAEIYESQKAQRKRQESKFHKHNRLGIRDGEWCRVNTDGLFEYHGDVYMIDTGAEQYQPIETDSGLLYDMDKILVCGDIPLEFYDMNYDKVKVRKL